MRTIDGYITADDLMRLRNHSAGHHTLCRKQQTKETFSQGSIRHLLSCMAGNDDDGKHAAAPCTQMVYAWCQPNGANHHQPPQDIARGNSPPRGARPTMRERDRRATRLSSCCHFPNPSISTTLFLTTRSHHHPPCRRCGWKTRHAPSAWTRSSTSRMTWTRSCLSRPQTAVSTLVGFGWFPLALPDTFFCLPHTRC